jgi:hypothetical protein
MLPVSSKDTLLWLEHMYMVLFESRLKTTLYRVLCARYRNWTWRWKREIVVIGCNLFMCGINLFMCGIGCNLFMCGINPAQNYYYYTGCHTWQRSVDDDRQNYPILMTRGRKNTTENLWPQAVKWGLANYNRFGTSKCTQQHWHYIGNQNQKIGVAGTLR